jgi:hypothetical protein
VVALRLFRDLANRGPGTGALLAFAGLAAARVHPAQLQDPDPAARPVVREQVDAPAGRVVPLDLSRLLERDADRQVSWCAGSPTGLGSAF